MHWVAGFWFVAGVLCGLGAALLLLPVFRGTAAGGTGARVSRWSVVAGAIGIAAVIALYLWLGRPELIGAPAAGPVVPHVGASGATSAPAAEGGKASSMDAAVASLEARLAQGKGTDADWELLAKSYEFLGRSADAAAARAKQLSATRMVPAPAVPVVTRPLDAAALKLVDQANAARQARKYAQARDIYAKLAARGTMTAETWADYADVAASASGSLSGEPEKYIAAALALDPQNVKALWLQGSLLHESGRYAQAIVAWQRLAAVLDPASSDAKLIANNIAEDRRLAGGPAGPPNTSAAPAAGAVAAGAPGAAPVSVSGEVTLADSVKSRAVAGLTLYVLARAVDQPGPPVAVLRTSTGQWPYRFKLDDSSAVMPGRVLSGAGQVTIEARISKSGLATPAAGDLQGSSAVIDPKAGRPLHIVIDHVLN